MNEENTRMPAAPRRLHQLGGGASAAHGGEGDIPDRDSSRLFCFPVAYVQRSGPIVFEQAGINGKGCGQKCTSKSHTVLTLLLLSRELWQIPTHALGRIWLISQELSKRQAANRYSGPSSCGGQTHTERREW